jgi:multisubunit Na+/H+ antiporter MnhG subunit
MAIWNREKIIVLIAIGVWVTDVAFLLNGEYLLPIIEVFLTNPVISQVAYG